MGTGDFDRLPQLLQDGGTADATIYGGAAHLLPDLAIPRVRTGHFFSAYLKISEGCDHTCSFCIIPKIRGRHESRPLDSVVAEAAALVRDGVVELNLIAQDLTAYGRDRRDGSSLAALLRELARIDGLRWIRLLYNYPRYVTDELLDTIAREEKVCSYIDMPLQHISDRMLRAMRRERDGAAVRRLIQRMRQRIPGVAIRTSFIVGFPGETDADFAELLAFVEEARFERVGVFRYSKEEGTAAAILPGQLPERVKRHRFNLLMRAQAEVSATLNRRLVGSVQAGPRVRRKRARPLLRPARLAGAGDRRRRVPARARRRWAVSHQCGSAAQATMTSRPSCCRTTRSKTVAKSTLTRRVNTSRFRRPEGQPICAKRS